MLPALTRSPIEEEMSSQRLITDPRLLPNLRRLVLWCLGVVQINKDLGQLE